MGRGRDVITYFCFRISCGHFRCRIIFVGPFKNHLVFALQYFLLVSLTVLIAAFTPTYFITKALVSMKGGWGWPHLLWLSKLCSHVTIVSDCSRAAFTQPFHFTKAPISMKNGWGCHTYSTEI